LLIQSPAAHPSGWPQIESVFEVRSRVVTVAAICIAVTAWLRVSARPGSQVTSQLLPARLAVCRVWVARISVAAMVMPTIRSSRSSRRVILCV
jgi:hypothetical protein